MWLCARPVALRAQAKQGVWRNSHFAMDNWFYSQPKMKVAVRVKMLKDLGYSGMVYSLVTKQQRKDFPNAIKALDQQKMKLVGIVSSVLIDGGGVPAELKQDIKAIAGRDTLLMVQLRSQQHPRSSAKGDAAATAVLRQIAAQCAIDRTAGAAMYPAKGNWLELVDHAVRLAKKVNLPAVGTMFNQYHWMRQSRRGNLGQLLTQAAPYLKSVTINGSDDKKPDIRPLGEGNFDTLQIVKLLDRIGYKHEVGTNGYKISGDVRAKLKASIAVWKDYKTRL